MKRLCERLNALLVTPDLFSAHNHRSNLFCTIFERPQPYENGLSTTGLGSVHSNSVVCYAGGWVEPEPSSYCSTRFAHRGGHGGTGTATMCSALRLPRADLRTEVALGEELDDHRVGDPAVDDLRRRHAVPHAGDGGADDAAQA